MYNLLLNAIYIIAKKFHITFKMNLYQILKQSFFEWNVGGIKRETGMLVRYGMVWRANIKHPQANLFMQCKQWQIFPFL